MNADQPLQRTPGLRCRFMSGTVGPASLTPDVRRYSMRTRKTLAGGRALTEAEVTRELGRYFRRNGYVRRQNPKRLSREGYLGYKKGDEVRLTAHDQQELLRIKALLRRAGFRPGRPFLKGRQYRLPIYGREAVRRFLKSVESVGNADQSLHTNRPPARPRTMRTA